MSGLLMTLVVPAIEAELVSSSWHPNQSYRIDLVIPCHIIFYQYLS